MPPLYDVIIAGAGISGLGAAHKLAQAGRKVLILESRDRTGGRIWSVEAGNINFSSPSCSSSSSAPSCSSSSSSSSVAGTAPTLIDLGASFVHGIIDNPLTELSRKVPFKLHLPSTEDGSDSLAAYAPNAYGQAQDGEEVARLEYLSHLVTFQRLHEYAQRGGPRALGPEPSEEDSILSELLRQQSDEDEENGIWRGIDAKSRKEALKMIPLWSGWTGAELKDVSLKYWGWEREFRGEDAVVLPGYKTLVDWHVRQVNEAGGETRLGSKVDKVELIEDERVRIEAAVDDGKSKETFEAKYFICSLPLGVMQHSPPQFHPPLPPRRTAALHRLGMGLLNKIVLTYSRAWWHAPKSKSQVSSKASGSEWLVLLGDDEDVPVDAPVLDQLRKRRLLGQDYSRINSTPTILFFIGPPLAQAIEGLEDDVIQEVIHDRLVSCLGPAPPVGEGGVESEGRGEGEDKDEEVSSIPRPIQTYVTRWLSDPHARGSYSYFPSRTRNRSPEPTTLTPSTSASSTTTTTTTPRPGGGPLDMMELARPLWEERLGFCGEATEENHFASVHGPLITGWREAGRVESLLREKEEEEDRVREGSASASTSNVDVCVSVH